MTLLLTKEVTAGYGNIAIVHQASTVVQQNSITLLVGANGSGKSTLVKCIVGQASTFSGQVYFQGHEITKKQTHEIIRTGIGYCPQIGNVFSGLTVRKNFELGAYASDNTGDMQERVEEVLTLFPDLNGRMGSKASTLSGGLRQMVAIGRALIGKPKVLILDEPTANMAPIAVKNLLSKIAQLRNMGLSILLVEQNVRSSVEIADYVYLMSQGKVMSEYLGSEIRKLDVGELMIKSVAAKS